MQILSKYRAYGSSVVFSAAIKAIRLSQGTVLSRLSTTQHCVQLGMSIETTLT